MDLLGVARSRRRVLRMRGKAWGKEKAKLHCWAAPMVSVSATFQSRLLRHGTDTGILTTSFQRRSSHSPCERFCNQRSNTGESMGQGEGKVALLGNPHDVCVSNFSVAPALTRYRHRDFDPKFSTTIFPLSVRKALQPKIVWKVQQPLGYARISCLSALFEDRKLPTNGKGTKARIELTTSRKVTRHHNQLGYSIATSRSRFICHISRNA